MTADGFNLALLSIGWSVRSLAFRLDCNPTLTHRWSKGDAPVPEPVAAWLERLALCHQRNPVPDDWRVLPLTPAAVERFASRRVLRRSSEAA